MSCNRKSRNPRCWWTWLGGVAAAPSAALRFGRWWRWVVKVFREKSRGPASDAHRMLRYRTFTWEIAETTDIGQNPDTSRIFMIFVVLRALNRCKRVLLRLRSTRDVPYVVWVSTRSVTVGKRPKSSKIHSKISWKLIHKLVYA